MILVTCCYITSYSDHIYNVYGKQILCQSINIFWYGSCQSSKYRAKVYIVPNGMILASVANTVPEDKYLLAQ